MGISWTTHYKKYNLLDEVFVISRTVKVKVSIDSPYQDIDYSNITKT